MSYSRKQFIQKLCRWAARDAIQSLGLEDAPHSKLLAHCVSDFHQLASELPLSLLMLEAERLDLDATHLNEEKLREAVGRWMIAQQLDAASEDTPDAS